MTNSYDVDHGLSQDHPGPLEPVEAAKVPATPVAGGWLPIESAPKDGSEILAWRHDCGQFIASYTSADAFPLTQAEIDAMDEATLFAKDWFTQWPQALRLEGSEVPTLWQPMRADPCATCNGNGMIGGPSYYAPDEGGEPCPDCSALPATPDEPYTVVLDPDPRGVSVGVYQGSSCVYNGAHPIPTGATGEEQDESGMSPYCPECNGGGRISVLSDNSPDAHDVDIDCTHCGGSGSAAAAAKNLARALQSERMQHLQIYGEYKNFHRSLCARFGYGHDPVHFRRDLVSLEEAIAAKVSAPAAGDAQPAVAPEWINCESRRPWVANGLRAAAHELRGKEKGNRTAFNKDFMGLPSRYMADAYAEAAAVFERRLGELAAQRKGDA